MSEQTRYIFSIIFWKPDISQIYGGKEGHCYWMFTLYFNPTPIYIFEFFVLRVIFCPSELFLSFDLSQNRMQNS